MNRRTLTAALLFLCACAASAAGTGTLRLRLTGTPITVDGRIDPAWMAADSVEILHQQQPYHGRPPSFRTVAKVLTTGDALYCLITCSEPRDLLEANTGVLDEANGDVVSIMLDTFNDRQTAYRFCVSASGVRADCRLVDDARNRDYTWDGIWRAASQIADSGYVVEMAIPYRSLKFSDDADSWGIDFDRWIPALKEDLYWQTYEQNEGIRISKFGRLEFEGFRPSAGGLSLELYPLAIARATYTGSSYETDPDVGLDAFYNPSEQLTFLLTANPDFAQIEADPFDFNVSRYESYYSERRPFFTEGNEAFAASGRQNNTGFYRPLELFYSRRIGKILPDGEVVPIHLGTKAFGRLGGLEYGGFVALTGETPHADDGIGAVEPRAVFGSARLKQRILENSSVGILAVAKQTSSGMEGVVDIDGAFRSSDWQLSYQLARSFQNGSGDFAGAAGFLKFGSEWMLLSRTRVIGKRFDVDQVGFVPWRGTAELTAVGGPTWYLQEGAISQITVYGGASTVYEDIDLYTDAVGILGCNFQFRDGWGCELTTTAGRSRDEGILYTSYEVTWNSWYNVSPAWNGNFGLGYLFTYNFAREYTAPVGFLDGSISWRALSILRIGASVGLYAEWTPDGPLEEVTYNARPFLSFTPVNNLNLSVYVDNIWLRSSGKIESMVGGLLLSYNFLPKSWIYLALNEVRQRPDPEDGLPTPRMATTHRAGVFKIKYLYYL